MLGTLEYQQGRVGGAHAGVSSGNVLTGQSTPTCFSLWALTEGIRNLEGIHWSHLGHESASLRKMGWGLGNGGGGGVEGNGC